MEQLLKHSDSVYHQTVEAALELQKIREKLSEIDKEKAAKLGELLVLKSKLHATTKNENVLSSRNMAMREKITELEEQTKDEAQDIRKEMKTFFKMLGLKVQFEKKYDLPATLCEMRIRFAEKRHFSAILVYDSVTEDYDLLELQPEHPRFDELRKFLRATKDVKGFLYSYRELICNLTSGKEN